MSFPIWWDWELEFIPHIEKRMIQRGLTEIELRAMLFHVNSILIKKLLLYVINIQLCGSGIQGFLRFFLSLLIINSCYLHEKKILQPT